MKIEGGASPKFIKSCLPESMIYTSEHMTINHCPSNKLGPFRVLHGYWQLRYKQRCWCTPSFFIDFAIIY